MKLSSTALFSRPKASKIQNQNRSSLLCPKDKIHLHCRKLNVRTRTIHIHANPHKGHKQFFVTLSVPTCFYFNCFIFDGFSYMFYGKVQNLFISSLFFLLAIVKTNLLLKTHVFVNKQFKILNGSFKFCERISIQVVSFF